MGAGLALAGCGSFDPTDWFSSKKPIPGDRSLVFPEGVPGVPQGVPPELVKGSQPEVEPSAVATADAGKPAEGAQPTASASAKPAPAAKPKSKVATRSKPKQARTRARKSPSQPKQAPTQVTVQPAEPASQPASQAAARPAPSPASRPAAQPVAQQPTRTDQSIWGPTPGQGANAPWPATTTQRAPTAPWPDPPSPNTFSR